MNGFENQGPSPAPPHSSPTSTSRRPGGRQRTSYEQRHSSHSDRWNNAPRNYTQHQRPQSSSNSPAQPSPSPNPKKEFLEKVRSAAGGVGTPGPSVPLPTPSPITPGLQKFFESVGSGPKVHHPPTIKTKVPEPPVNRREHLIHALSTNSYECMICCAKIYERQSIWNCENCNNSFHLSCTKKWVDSSVVQSEWRCPGCQNIVNVYPRFYYCFCGKAKNPPYSGQGQVIPHSCGSSCGKRKDRSDGASCQHFCTLPCHPGPCEDCVDIVKRTCACGKSSAFVQCQSKNPVLCGQICGKTINCKIHFCSKSCHSGPCDDCAEIITLKCHCSRNVKEVPCTETTRLNNSYSCELKCGKLLNCRNHHCESQCHPGLCAPCPTSLDVIVSCPCGQTSIDESCRSKGLPLRRSCEDPIPVCDKKCGKLLPCGSSEDKPKHCCTKNCHNGSMEPCYCPLITQIPCRCGNRLIDINCEEYIPGAEVLCKKKCTKKRQCGRHKCNGFCCIDPEHICPIVCDKLLSCGLHRCESLCHNGHCSLCSRLSFDELRCHCGESVIYPPVPCGTNPPTCMRPCNREHPCGHSAMHKCHSEPTCPPCTVLTEKWCHGKHELRKNVSCFNNNVSCGFNCLKILKCGRHKCQKICHPGRCESPTDKCTMPCNNKIKCGHNCPIPCHDGDCPPDILCKKLVQVTCPCNRRKEGMLCWKREIEFEKLVKISVGAAMAKVMDPFSDLDDEEEEGQGAGESEESRLSKLTAKIQSQMNRLVILKCDKECARVERSRKMAEALQLDNPDPETRLGPPNYSDFLKKVAQKSPQFVEMVHEKLSSLVMKTKSSKQPNSTYAFDSMNREKRTVIHEYSDHFGLQSESFDAEPNRNVIVTASKDKCWLPSVSLIDVVYRKPSLREAERKNVYQDLELSQPPMSKILGPANMKFKS